MLQKLKDLIFKSQGLEEVTTPTDKRMVFMVMHGTTHVGTLELENGEWAFAYARSFQQNFKSEKASTLAPLIGFPDVEKEYRSEVLWPFFAGRIPGLKQPAVKAIIEREHIQENDLAALLERFGKKTIASPFELVAQNAVQLVGA